MNDDKAASPVPNGERCSICGTPYGEPQRKWNGGNPITIRRPQCTCEEDATFDAVMRRFATRRANTDGPT